MARLALRFFLAALFALVALPSQAQQARVVTTCGSLAPFGPQAAGSVAFPTVDTTGKLCLSGGGGGGSIVGGTTPVTGTCPSGQFLYNNSGVVGCSASSATIALPQAVTGGVSGGIPYFSATTTMASSALLAANALMIGKGAGVAPTTTTTGTGILAALGLNTNAAGGVALVSTVPTVGNFVKWAAGGLVDGGAGSGGGITAGTTTTSGFTAGQAIYSDGALAQAATSYYSANTSSQRNGANAQTEKVYNTYTDASNGEWGTFDWTTTANTLTIGAQANGTGTARNVQIAAGGFVPVTFSAGGMTLSAGGYNFIINGASNFFAPTISSSSTVSTQPTITGAGGTCATAGTKTGTGFIAGTIAYTAVCAAGNTIAFTGMPTQTNGYVCDAENRSLPASLTVETASTTTGFTLTVSGTSSASGNVLQWKCIGY